MRGELDRIRTAPPKAAHVCWAFATGQPKTIVTGMGDAGKPRGTACISLIE